MAANLKSSITQGNDMGVRFKREFLASKEKAVDTLDQIQKNRQLNAQLNKKKVKRNQVKKKILMSGRGYLSNLSN